MNTCTVKNTKVMAILNYLNFIFLDLSLGIELSKLIKNVTSIKRQNKNIKILFSLGGKIATFL